MKRKLFTLATIVICLSILAGGTFANFTTEGTAHNVITSGKVDVALLEWSEADKVPFPTDPVPVMPGTTVPKIVEVKNEGVSDAWIRVKVTKNIDMADGITEQPDLSLVEIDFDTTKWTYADGYYYYNDALTPQDTTEPLFKSVTFKGPEMKNEYQNSWAYVNVYVMAVQKANNGETVFEAAGWPGLPDESETQQ